MKRHIVAEVILRFLSLSLSLVLCILRAYRLVLYGAVPSLEIK